jgi:hypothetical protein
MTKRLKVEEEGVKFEIPAVRFSKFPDFLILPFFIAEAFRKNLCVEKRRLQISSQEATKR